MSEELPNDFANQQSAMKCLGTILEVSWGNSVCFMLVIMEGALLLAFSLSTCTATARIALAPHAWGDGVVGYRGGSRSVEE